MADGGIRSNELRGAPKQFSASSRHDLFRFEHISVETCNVMNFLGYGLHIRQARRDAYKAMDRHYSTRTNSTYITTGSKAEGLTCYLESDTDTLCVAKGVFCSENGVNSNRFPAGTNILRSCTSLSYPGHCRLLLERYGKSIERDLYDALCDDGYGRKLLSSALYVNEFLKYEHSEGIVKLERAGPSLPSTMLNGLLKHDTVHALHFDCPSILTRWATRPRNWPTPDVVQEVVSLGAFVCPDGFKGSVYEHVEWRICFNTGENELVKNLNDTQVKLYVLLKMVKSDVLKPRKKEITSFIVKNIVLWIAENNPQSLFHERSLFHWLHEGLYALRVAIDKKELPYYMIPERNLMAACALELEQKLSWIATVDEMIQEGPRIILRLPKIRHAIIAHPEPLRWYSRRKIELEMLYLVAINRELQGLDSETDVIIYALLRREWWIWGEFIARMIMEGAEYDNIRWVRNRLLM